MNHHEMLPPLPIGTSSFSLLRCNNAIYIDKTKMIYNLALKRKVFLVRPRRFGKSLLVSTFETLFRDGLKNFERLEISKLWNDKKYNVLKLDFSCASDFNSIEEFLRLCWGLFDSAFAEGGFSFEATKGETPEEILRKFLQELEDNSLVLLIDEYDSPLTSHLSNPDLFNDVKKYLSKMYRLIKSKDNLFRFVFITGITRFDNNSIFKDLNDLDDVSLDKDFGTLLGFTENEIKKYLWKYINQAADVNKTTQEKILQDIKKQYDGFCFDDEASTHVYVPWSILNFFEYPDRGLQNYWYESSGQSSLLLEYLNKIGFFNADCYNNKYSISIDSLKCSNDISSLNYTAILLQAGYLTIKRVQNKRLLIGYPNNEVASSVAILSINNISTEESKIEEDIDNISEKLSKNNPEDIIDLFNSIFTYIPYDKYPISNESMCRAILLALLAGAGIFPLAENENAFGRSDLEIVSGDIHWVFELKFLAKDNGDRGGQTKGKSGDKSLQANALRLLAEALEQIRDKEYGSAWIPGTPVIRMALVFSEAARQFVEWETFPLIVREPPYKGWQRGLVRELKKAKRGVWTAEMLSAIQPPKSARKAKPKAIEQ